jgi:cobalamin biosynthesis protein CobT
METRAAECAAVRCDSVAREMVERAEGGSSDMGERVTKEGAEGGAFAAIPAVVGSNDDASEGCWTGEDARADEDEGPNNEAADTNGEHSDGDEKDKEEGEDKEAIDEENNKAADTNGEEADDGAEAEGLDGVGGADRGAAAVSSNCSSRTSYSNGARTSWKTERT